MFRITDYIEFDSKGRAICPSCDQEGKGKKKNLALIPNTDGAYKCHRGCTPVEIRSALGAPKGQTMQPPTQPSQTVSSNVTVTPQKVKQQNKQLLTKSKLAIEWLNQKGITNEMISYYQLGVCRARSGSKMLMCISIPIPTADKTAYFQKKRVSPWTPIHELPKDTPAWKQYGIPSMTFFTHLPEQASRTWQCEGEWDAIRLGWLVKSSEQLKDSVAVACFTTGCGNVPTATELDKLPGQVTIFYDRNDKPTKSGLIPGEDGARKLAIALSGRSAIAHVPMPDDCLVHGWDVSNALDAGYTLEDFVKAEQVATEVVKPTAKLWASCISNDDLLDTADDYVEWLVPDILTQDEMFMLAAPPRAGKSLFALSLALSVASGQKFLDRPVNQGPVIYCKYEDSNTKIKQREHAQGWPRGLPVYWLDRAFKLNQPHLLRELVEQIEPRLIVIDTLSRARMDAAGEGAAEIGQIIEPIQDISQDFGVTSLLVHHTKKINAENLDQVDIFDQIRGSSALRATCRGTLLIAADDRSYRLYVENGFYKGDLNIILNAHTLRWNLLGNWNPTIDNDHRTLVMDFMNKAGAANIQQIHEATGIPKSSLYVVLSRLHADDLLRKEGSRRKVTYIRDAQHIKQLGTVLDSGNADDVSDSGSYLTKNTFSSRETPALHDATPSETLKACKVLDNAETVDTASVSESNSLTNVLDNAKSLHSDKNQPELPLYTGCSVTRRDVKGWYGVLQVIISDHECTVLWRGQKRSQVERLSNLCRVDVQSLHDLNIDQGVNTGDQADQKPLELGLYEGFSSSMQTMQPPNNNPASFDGLHREDEGVND